MTRWTSARHESDAAVRVMTVRPRTTSPWTPWIALALLGSCRPDAPAPREPTPPQPVAPVPDAGHTAAVPTWTAALLPKDAGGPTLDHVVNLDRVPGLDARQRELLAKQGFFVALQPGPKPADSAAGQRTRARAKHLFQVYERNDYVRFPSYVTVDLAIDLTHQYFDVVLRRLEREHLVPKLRTALQELVKQTAAQQRSARSPEARRAAHDAALWWAVALRLLEQSAAGDRPDEIVARNPYPEMDDGSAPVPPATRPRPTKLPRELEREVASIVARVHAAAGKERFEAWGLELDLSQAKPRSHYADDGVLQRYFRAMTWLGLSSFAIEGTDARPDLVLALVHGFQAAPAASKPMSEVLTLSSFIVGAPPTAGLAEALASARAAAPAAADATLQQWLSPALREPILAAWRKLPAHPIASDRGPVIEPVGKRVFADTQAMAAMLPIVRDLPETAGADVLRMMGAAGAAAVLGDATASEIAAGDQPAVAAAILRGRAAASSVRTRDDAYHRTLVALDAVLHAQPTWFEPKAWQLRTLQSFAGGWAQLRHDTLLYAYQMGAECDAQELPSPHGWVEPMPEVYAALREMVERFASQLERAGIHEAPPADDEGYGFSQFATLHNKTEAIVGLLRQLETLSNKELRGERFTDDERRDIATIGGLAEHVLLTFADAYELGEGNDDMAVVADVFTWRDSALEVGVAHPELIYAVIPTPEGWMLARGAVLGYRELLVPANDRLTDQRWREQLAASKDFLARHAPSWLAPIRADPVPVIELPADGQAQSRCEYFGGAFEL